MSKAKVKPTQETNEAEGLLARMASNSRSALNEVRDMDFDALLAQMEQHGGLVDAAQLGDGYHLLQGKDEKKKLVGQPLIIVDWNVNPGRFGGFTSLKVKTKFPVVFNGTGYQNFIVNDGGTGIKRQIADFEQNLDGPRMIVCRQGLRVSEDYEVMEDYVDESGDKKQRPVIDPATGKPVLGTTFYLDTSL